MLWPALAYCSDPRPSDRMSDTQPPVTSPPSRVAETLMAIFSVFYLTDPAPRAFLWRQFAISSPGLEPLARFHLGCGHERQRSIGDSR